MRNVLIHGYVAERDLGKLRSQIEAILDER
jgi:hypothetical protein